MHAFNIARMYVVPNVKILEILRDTCALQRIESIEKKTPQTGKE